MHNYLQHLNNSESSAKTPSKMSQNTLKIGPIINHGNYLISSQKYIAYRIIQTDLLGKYFAELNNNTNAKHLYPKVYFLEFIKTQTQ